MLCTVSFLTPDSWVQLFIIPSPTQLCFLFCIISHFRIVVAPTAAGVMAGASVTLVELSVRLYNALVHTYDYFISENLATRTIIEFLYT